MKRWQPGEVMTADHEHDYVSLVDTIKHDGMCLAKASDKARKKTYDLVYPGGENYPEVRYPIECWVKRAGN